MEKKDVKSVQFGMERIAILFKVVDKAGPDKVDCNIKEISAIKDGRSCRRTKEMVP